MSLLPACGTEGASFQAAPNANNAGAGLDGGGGGVDETLVGGAGGGGSQPVVDDAPLYDPNHVLEVQITLAPADWDTIRLQSRELGELLGEDCQSQPFASPFSYVHADVVVDGVARADVGLRKKGFLGSLDENKPSLKLSLDEYTDQELYGTHDITLNNAKQDPSYLNQCLGYAAFAAAGVPASRCNFAHISVNGEDLGLYVHVEAIKKPMLRRHFDSDEGNLYEGTLSDFRRGWLDTFEKKTNESEPLHPELDVLTAAAEAPDEQLIDELVAALDVEEFISFWAIEVLLQHWDGYAGNQNNFYVYADPTTHKVSLLPWGIDQLFGGAAEGNGKPEAILTTGVLAHRLYSSPDGRARFAARTRTLLDTVWDVPALGAEIDRMVELVTPVLTDGERFWQSLAVAQLKARIEARRAALLSALATPAGQLSPLRGLVCFREIGSVSGTFSTTWGTAGTPEPFAAGTATLDAVVDGVAWSLMPDSIGAVAGAGEDPASAFPDNVAVPALRTDGMLGVLYFGLKPEQVKPGDIFVSPGTAPALLLEVDPDVKDAPARVLGAVFGTLHFDSAATKPLAPVSGTYQGKLYASGLLGTQ
jgi:hypothetical protein